MLFFVLFFSSLLGIEPRATHMLSTCFTTCELAAEIKLVRPFCQLGCRLRKPWFWSVYFAMVVKSPIYCGLVKTSGLVMMGW